MRPGRRVDPVPRAIHPIPLTALVFDNVIVTDGVKFGIPKPPFAEHPFRAIKASAPLSRVRRGVVGYCDRMCVDGTDRCEAKVRSAVHSRIVASQHRSASPELNPETRRSTLSAVKPVEPLLSKLADDIPKNWYTLIENDGATLSLPGIYEWEIEGAGSYIGRYTHRYRPMREYERNVFKISTGRAYRPSKPDGFRRIHRELELAYRQGRAITLIIVENCMVSDLNQREAFHISDRGTLNGRVRGDRS